MTDLKLEPGMLLLQPSEGSLHPKVWTVRSPRTLIHYSEGIVQTATLTKSGLPKGWQMVESIALARHLNTMAGHGRLHRSGRILDDD